MDGQTRKALARLVRAAREWAPTPLTRTGAGTKDRLEVAVHHLNALDVEVMEELEGPGLPALVAFHGQALQDFLTGWRELSETDSPVFALEFMMDQEGMKVRINGGPTWSPGFGEPRGSQ